jgi:O-acetyl-ADP-ribose deacetylase (regulator of RNase III)
MKTRVTIVGGDITKQPDIDAIVNAANEQLRAGAGVCGAIFRAAGWQALQDECWNEQHPIIDTETRARVSTGSATFTNAYNLPNKFIVHAVGPVYDDYEPEEAERLLEEAYLSGLQTAHAHGCKSIAFPAISCGVYGYPWDEAATVALRACKKWVTERAASNVEEIRFVIFEPELLDIFRNKYEAVFGTTSAG